MSPLHLRATYLVPALGFAVVSPLHAQDPGRPPRGIEARFAQLSETIPGFGGFYFDDEGNLVAFVTDTVHAAAVRTALDSTLRSRPRGLSVRPTASPRVIVQQGRFAFTQLAGWRDQVIPAVLAQVPDVVFIDLDELRNRVTIAVASQAATVTVQQAVAALGIPSDAIHVFVRKPIRVRASRPSRAPVIGLSSPGKRRQRLPYLTNRMRPVEGGVKISIPVGASQATCSLAANAYIANVLGFLTASHCTNVRGGTNNTAFYQSDYTSGATHHVGTEHLDPAWTTPSSKITGTLCPAGYSCRDSDAAFVRYADPSPSVVQSGYIARTTYYGTGTGAHGSTEIDASKPPWHITGSRAYPSVGDKLHKEGFVSGRTWGTVQNSCIHLGQTGTSYYLFCQDLILGAAFTEGDSGAPVFAVPGTAESTDVMFFGVAWGGTDEDTVLSARDNLEADLGVIDVF